MKKKQAENPSFLSVLITALFSLPDIRTSPILRNNFSLAVLHLPLFEISEDSYSQIELVEKYWKDVKEKPDFLLLRADKITMSISNVPGMPKVKILGGQQLEKLVFFTPHRDTTGVGFTITTYNNKFQMGLMIDKVFNCSKEEAQSLVDNLTHLGDTQLLWAINRKISITQKQPTLLKNRLSKTQNISLIPTPKEHIRNYLRTWSLHKLTRRQVKVESKNEANKKITGYHKPCEYLRIASDPINSKISYKYLIFSSRFGFDFGSK
nr:unnamed protein product [Callosobruchus analis]